MTTSSAANRGKEAEKAVKDYLKLLESAHMNFTAHRVPDAHAAGGRFTPQAGDFAAYWGKDGVSRNWILEVKQLKHDYRLPYASYSEDKVARVRKRVLAGSEAIVVLYHSVTKVWRLVPFEVFTDRSVGGSWDLREYPVVDWKRALSDFLGVTP